MHNIKNQPEKQKINFYFHIYKIGSFYHMLESLSETFHSHREFSNKYWVRETGPLKKEEKKALEEFKNVIKKYHFGHEKYLGKFLQTKSRKRAFKELKENFEKEECEAIINTFNVFSLRFEKIWNLQRTHLNSWKKRLDKEVKINANNIIRDIISILPTRPVIKDIDVFLLISGGPDDGLGGGANLGPQRITLEAGMASKEKVKAVLKVFWHEVFHAISGSSFVFEFIDSYLAKTSIPKKILELEKRNNPNEIVNEVATKVFDLYVQNKYLEPDGKITEEDLLRMINPSRRKPTKFDPYLSKIYQQKGMNLLAEYVSNGRKLDFEFFDNLIKLYLDYAKKIK